MSGLEQQVIERMRGVSGPIQPELTPSRMRLANVAVGANPTVALPSSVDRNPSNCDVHGRDPQCPLNVCAVRRRRFPVGVSPTRQPLQPEATGAVMEVTKWLEPLV
jgi:hypothetical protein